MQLFKKKHFSNNEFPKSSARMQFLKDNERQGRHTMSSTLDKLIQETKIDNTIDLLLDFNMPEAEIIQKICDKFKLDEPTAQEYYDDYMRENAE